MNARDTTVRYPLHVTISVLFIALVVALGGVLSWQNYRKTSGIILTTAGQVFDQITRELILDFNGTYHPVAGALRLLALAPVTTAATLDERLASLGTFTVALANEPSVSGIQIGYGNGDYFIVRPLHTQEVRRHFGAPDDAAFVADQVDTAADGKRRLVRLYFDAQSRELLRAPPQATDYDPRTRPWYTAASARPAATRPYLFYFLGMAGTTVTLAAPVPGVVVASDVTLERLSETTSRHRMTASSEVVLVGADGKVLAYRDPGKLVRSTRDGTLEIAGLSQLGSPVLTQIAGDFTPGERSLDFDFHGQRWIGSVRKVASPGGVDLFALMVAPVDELLSEAVRMRWQSVTITGLIVLLAIPLVWLMARKVARPLHQLAGEAGLISRFDFDSPIRTRSFIREVDELATAMGLMKTTISRFLTLINSLAGERNFDALLEGISRETLSVSEADGVLTYLADENDAWLAPGTLQLRGQGRVDIGDLPRYAMEGDNALVSAARGRVSRLLRLREGEECGLEPLLRRLAARALNLIALPLRNRQGMVIGVLCLLYRDEHGQAPAEPEEGHIAFVTALSGFAAVSLESRHLLMMQEALLDAFIKLIAGAIDSKSPYTGGHCQRVPELTRLLAEAACASDAPPFRDFRLNEEQWEALDIASWLHDCGKVTTPEYVVDKSTKLETLYDRIHEVRMRFEVLKRDAAVRYWEAVADGGDRDALRRLLETEWAQLDADFAFVAACNEGGESLDAGRLERLRQIARRTWQRTLDDRIGISWEEMQRKNRTPPAALPVEERLLDDKAEHLIERTPADRMAADNPWGFRLEVPQYKYNRGELYNLAVERGTLTPEERYQINDHIVQTIIMLEKLPYPRHLREVPQIAGCHHEKMDGGGYPRRLTGTEMPMTARMMAIADIFEALTASDRPYKKAKTLSEAVRIMHRMKDERHIDPDLFELFLASGIHLEYGRRFLQPEQLDEVDVTRYLRGELQRGVGS
jgi:HD-GYP domain-containing protein (c-di-GMP phosphodiesterase class II)